MSSDVFVDELIERAKARGLTITIGDGGQCYITGKRDKATDTLLNALKEWKPAIVKRLRPDALDRVLELMEGEKPKLPVKEPEESLTDLFGRWQEFLVEFWRYETHPNAKHWCRIYDNYLTEFQRRHCLPEARRIEQEMMDARRQPKETPPAVEPDAIDCEAVFAEAAKEREFIDFVNQWNQEKRKEHDDKR